ncbi:class I SAM-dependent methyltransferase [Paenibacillus marinisediminis]
MQPTHRFTGKAGVYSQYRPGYPMGYIDYLISSNGLTPDHIVADIGAGTGILTRQLLDQGLKVIAVEPNDDMRANAEGMLNHYPNFSSVKGTAEHSGLTDHSVDLVTAAQAFHWFDQEQFKEECKRILKLDALVALVWNSRDSSSELVIENARICKAYCPAFQGFSGGIEETPEIYERFFRNGKYDYQVVDHPIAFDKDSFIGRNLSASYAPKSSDEQYEPFVEAITALFDSYSTENQLIMRNLTRSYIGRV